MATKATRKALTNLSLIYGLVNEIKDEYKHPEYIKRCESILETTNKAIDLWPEGIDEKTYHETKNKILKLRKDLNNRDKIVYINCAFIILDKLVDKLKYEKKKYIEKLRDMVLDFFLDIERGGKNNCDKIKFSVKVLDFWEV